MALKDLYTKFKFTPANVIIEELRGYGLMGTHQYFAAYQWFVKKYVEHQRKLVALRDPHATIGHILILSLGADEITSLDEPKQRLVKLFGHIGNEYTYEGQFLSYCGLHTLADTLKPFWIHVPHSPFFPLSEWLSARGRKFNTSPAHYDGAVWIDNISVSLRTPDLWSVHVGYGYKREGARWHINFHQELNEDLVAFTKRVNSQLHESLEHEGMASWHRISKEDSYQKTKACFDGLFGTSLKHEHYKDKAKLADAFCERKGKIELTPARMKTLLEWIKDEQ